MEVPRDQVFVTTKVWNDRQGRAETRAAVQESLRRIATERVDLMLIHWPCPAKGLYLDTWRALIRLRGRTAHASMPETGLSPMAALSRLMPGVS